MEKETVTKTQKAPKAPKVPKSLKFQQFNWISVRAGAIQLMLFDDEIYSASFIVWVNESGFPLIMETNIFSDDKEDCILQALETLANLTDSFHPEVDVFDEEGDILETLLLKDYLPKSDDKTEE